MWEAGKILMISVDRGWIDLGFHETAAIEDGPGEGSKTEEHLRNISL